MRREMLEARDAFVGHVAGIVGGVLRRLRDAA